jgi:hypothetical protein
MPPNNPTRRVALLISFIDPVLSRRDNVILTRKRLESHPRR